MMNLVFALCEHHNYKKQLKRKPNTGIRRKEYESACRSRGWNII
jgi:hypothetical protein